MDSIAIAATAMKRNVRVRVVITSLLAVIRRATGLPVSRGDVVGRRWAVV
jgi:hypothetical protein